MLFHRYLRNNENTQIFQPIRIYARNFFKVYSNLILSYIRQLKLLNLIKSIALLLRRTTQRLLRDGSTGDFVVRKALSLYLIFSFLNRISLLLNKGATDLSSRGWVDPLPRPYISRKMSRVQPGIEPRTSWMTVRRTSHYTKGIVY